MVLRGLKNENRQDSVAKATETRTQIREQSRIDKHDSSKKLSKQAFKNYNKNGKINTDPLKKTKASKGFWESLFESLAVSFFNVFSEIIHVGKGIGGNKSETADKGITAAAA